MSTTEDFSKEKNTNKKQDRKNSMPSEPIKKYTTRQIMELTARRRAQMLAAAEEEQVLLRNKPAVAPPQEPSAPEIVNETPQTAEISPIPETPPTLEVTETVQPSFPDGKIASQFFRQEAETPKEQEIAQVIERQWDLAAKDAGLSRTKETQTVETTPAEETTQSRIPEIVPVEETQTVTAEDVPQSRIFEIASAEVIQQATPAIGPPAEKTFVIVAREMTLTTVMFGLFFQMFFTLLNTEFSKTIYDHGPYLLLVSMMCAWQERNHLQRREKISWPAIALCLYGFAVFSFAAVHGFLYWELGALILSVLSIFSGIYTDASARRLVFPLSYLVFVVPPPDFLVNAVAPLLNAAIIHTGYFFLYCANIPGTIHALTLHTSSYELSLSNSTASFCSIVTFAALAVLYIRLQRTSPLGKWILLLSIIPLAIAGNAMHVALTGLVAFNYGLEYARIFFQEYAVMTTFLCSSLGLAALAVYWEEEKAT